MGLRIWSFLGAALIIASTISPIPSNSTAKAQGHTISGKVTAPPSQTGPGIGGVTVTLTINSSTQTMVQTDSGGNFSFSNIAAGSNYMVTPTKPTYTFNPASQGGTDIQANVTLFFTGTTSADSTIQFAAATASVTESNVSMTITVTRTGGNTTGPATVRYATSDTAGANCDVVNGAASSRCDYSTTIGTLRFAGGETSKNILIPIINDVYVEGSETFTMTLSDASGAALGSPSIATITINESETGGANPIDQTNFFVRQHYIDFLNREPDTDGIGFWTGEIDNCTPKPQCTEIKRINVSAAFFLSIEFQETGYLVYRMYKAFGDLPGAPVPLQLLEFLPDTQQIGQGVVVGQTGWEQVLENNKNAFAADFVTRPRFVAAYPTTLSPAGFVARFFTNAGAQASPAEQQSFAAEFGGAPNTIDTAARARAVRRMAEHSDLVAKEFNKAFVLMQYFGYLRRNPNDAPESTLDFQGYNFWLNKLNQFNGNFISAEMVKAFITSGEYRQRFGR